MPAGLPCRLQDLPPEWAHFCLDVERFLTRELAWQAEGRRVVVCLSGGVDSSALLLVLHYLRPRLRCDLEAVHLDHCLRPESEDDARAAAALCEALGIRLTSGRRDVAQLARERGVGLEEAGRLARLEMLAGLVGAGCWAAQGHQLDDLAEDQLMRQLRGAGWPALGGMRGVAPGERIVRPLLLTAKARLRRFLEALGLSWREDPSNADRRFLRNRVRHEILPLLLRENPAYLDTAAALWRQARLDAGFWEQQLHTPLDKAASSEAGRLLLDADVLLQCAPAMRLRLFKECLEGLGPGQPLTEGLLRLERAFLERRHGAVLQFPGGKEARVTAQGVAFACEQ